MSAYAASVAAAPATTVMHAGRLNKEIGKTTSIFDDLCGKAWLRLSFEAAKQ